MQQAADPAMIRRWRRRSGDQLTPIPPRTLRGRVGDPSVGAWVTGGERVARELDGILEKHGRPLERFESICDFGCGSGRVLAQLHTEPAAVLHGMDVDREAIAWVRRHFPDVDARVNPTGGPAPFGEDSFDFLFSISIFTHLNQTSQTVWFEEIARLLRPDGLALVTVLGEELMGRWAAGLRPGLEERQRRLLREAPPLGSAGFVFAPEPRTRWNRWRYAGVEPDYGLAFWDHAALVSVIEEWFDVIAIVPMAINWEQDAVLLAPRSASGSSWAS
jgi:SAM-dependent methyltransferase